MNLQVDHSPFLDIKNASEFTSLVKHVIIPRIGFCLSNRLN